MVEYCEADFLHCTIPPTTASAAADALNAHWNKKGGGGTCKSFQNFSRAHQQLNEPNNSCYISYQQLLEPQHSFYNTNAFTLYLARSAVRDKVDEWDKDAQTVRTREMEKQSSVLKIS